jgi:30S ribosomal protein S31
MGKGDQRSRRGKIWRGTFGKRRPKKSNRVVQTSAEPPAEEKKGRAKKEAASGE